MTLDPDQLGRSKTDLAETLRRLRLEAGLTGDRLSVRCGISQSKISKIETGRITPSLVDVERILRALGASAELVQEISSLTRLANTEWQDKRASWRRGIEKRQAELASLEADATELRYFLPAMITGLLATPDYIRASLSHSPGDKTLVMDRKLERQSVLYDTSKSFTFLLTEQAVTWGLVPPQAMAIQIDRLASLSHLPTVRIGVVPYRAPLTRGPMNTFTLYDDRLATAESFTGRIVFRDPRDIRHYREIFAMFEESALYGDEVRAQLGEWSTAYRR
ncbi:XRE family transcriptional regulator [Kitasatospora xanthocidica]|uniref:XRE family transcriptional regulator n=1 Tax=Kitasatospora xanthocidica TaxID=83382 RepID=A0A372ZZZ4_9ACTN|nr:helix-turn-helix transcriptional regulator [Kitasatospora xanthocidica]RGD60950.1 XRE family transcriptional regulator [Kitasatospora xanthocidica]